MKIIIGLSGCLSCGITEIEIEATKEQIEFLEHIEKTIEKASGFESPSMYISELE